MQVLVLASSSTYRARLLKRLQLPFIQCAPEIDESSAAFEAPVDLAIRLAREKAQAVTSEKLAATADNVRLNQEHSSSQAIDSNDQPIDFASVIGKLEHANGTTAPNLSPPPACVIGSDQVAAVGSHLLGKPGTHQKATEQLLMMSGQSVFFHTAVYLHNFQSGQHFSALDTTTAEMRELSTEEIDRYLNIDKPYDCAGSFKVECLGVSLFKSIQTSDPTALEGLPLISICNGLRHLGIELP